jgi:stage II sporulation protein D
VGLCQVGAFGMARAGHTYEEIIKTYYQGVEIQKAY